MARRIAYLTSLYALLGASVSFAGWALGIPRATDWEGKGISIQPNTCLLLVLCGASLLVLQRGQRRLALGLGALAGLGGAATLLEHIAPIDFGFDRLLLFGHTWGQSTTVSPGRMGPPASASFTLLGCCLAAIAVPTPRWRSWAPWGALAVAGFMLFSLLGYLFQAENFYSVPWLTAIALQTATMILALAIGVIASVPEHQPMLLLCERSAAGSMARLVLPAILVTPPLVTWARAAGQSAGWYDSGTSRALGALALILFMSALMWAALLILRRRERKEREDQNRIAGLLGSITDAFVSWDPQWRFTFANEIALQRLGKSADDVIGEQVRTLLPGAVDGVAHALLRRAMHDRVAVEYETFHEPARRWFFERAYPTPDGGLAVYSTDITERKNSEHAIAEQLAVTTAIADSTSVMLTRCSRDLRYLHVNRAYAELLGLPREQIEGAPIASILGGEAFATIRPHIERVLVGEVVEYEAVIPFGRAGPRCMEVRYVPDRDGLGAVQGWYASLHDVTERKRTEQTLREALADAELLHRLTQDLARTGAAQQVYGVLVDAAVEIMHSDFASLQMLHPERGVRGGKGELQLLAHRGFSHESARHWRWVGAHSNCACGFALREERRCYVPDVAQDERITGPDRDVYARVGIRSVVTTPLLARTGRVLGAISAHWRTPRDSRRLGARDTRMLDVLAQLASDVLERVVADEDRAQLLDSERAARTEAEQAGRIKDEFLATLSHELRTPLSAILGWCHLLDRNPADAAAVREGLRVITRNARAQADLIGDLLDVSRIVSGKLHLELARVRLSDVVAAALESIRHAADAKGVELETCFDAGVGEISGDAGRLQQVVWNLLSNAVKFTPAGGRIEVSLVRRGTGCELSIRDTGIGMHAEILPHVFQRFRQADASTTRRYGGLGLGLAIVKHLVELHGGSVHADSPGEGLGSTFVVTLPGSASPRSLPDYELQPVAGPGNARAQNGKDVDLSGVKVLVIDDQRDTLDLLTRVLEERRAQVAAAASAEEGLRALVQNRPDIVLCDIGMPGRDGYAFIQQLRALGDATPALAVTAFARPEDKERALNAGFQGHVAKPVEPGFLLAMVAVSLRPAGRGAQP